MNKKGGVTLISLTVYVILLIVILVIFTFISANYTSQITEVVNKGKVSNEYIKIYSFLVTDLKSANRVVEYSEDFVRFDNDIIYTVKYLSNRANETIQYELYRNDVLIGENILDAKFDYENGNLDFNLKYLYGKTMLEKSQSFKVGKGY